MELRTQVNYTVRDIQQAYILHLGSGVLRSYTIGAVAIIMGFFFRIYDINAHMLSGFTLYMSLLLIGYGIFVMLRMSTIGRRTIKKNASLLDTYTVIFSDDEFRMFSENEDTKIKWQVIKAAKITKETILLYPNEAMFYFFPRRFFSERDFEELTLKARKLKQK